PFPTRRSSDLLVFLRTCFFGLTASFLGLTASFLGLTARFLANSFGERALVFTAFFTAFFFADFTFLAAGFRTLAWIFLLFFLLFVFVAIGQSTSGSRQIVRNESYSHRPFANGGRHPVHRAGSHIASGEDAGHAG